MDKQVFVAREQELARLGGFLRQALTDQGCVCFVVGEAGSGKTTLINEFTCRAQEEYGDLAVAIGQSDAQTGMGDAYLPFREVMGQLTGDVESKVAQGAITEENASRLQKLVMLSSQALIEVGPDLIGVFVPGAGLAARLGAFAADKAGWLDKLEKVVVKRSEGKGLVASDIEQSNIFEQYVNVLDKLAVKQPLLIGIDDLQWADPASIGLFFRLARRIGQQRILLIGTYRPEEIAIGRGGERHPLEKVLTEVKRYYGDIWIDLDQAQEREGQLFVSTFIDTETNELGEEFRHKLFQQTGGHALFTIELLRHMQERGDLTLDEHGCWVESPTLEWDALPVRVEGVIEERISRLGQELRTVLTVGSVEGEDFTAEVVARVQSANVRNLVYRLGSELERQHRLVKARGIRQLKPGGQRLSLYRFQHNLFQRYLYNELDAAERVYLHEDVGFALEDLYSDELDEIIVQLARHFYEARISDKAIYYLERAGESAFSGFAHEEAISHFSRALDLIPEDNHHKRYALLLAREQVYNSHGERDHQAQDLSDLKVLAQLSDDASKKAEVFLREAEYAYATSNYPMVVAGAQDAIRMAQSVEDISLEASGHYLWGAAAMYMGDYEISHNQLEVALEQSRAAGLRQTEAKSLRSLGVACAMQADFSRATAYWQGALQINREDENRPGECRTLNCLGCAHFEQGDYSTASDYFKQALSVVRVTGDRPLEATLLGNLGSVCFNQGDLQTSRSYHEQSLHISREVGDRRVESGELCNLAEVYATIEDLETARCYYEQALQLVREIGLRRTEIEILNNLGFTLAVKGEYVTARGLCEQSLQIARELGDKHNEAKALRNLGWFCDCTGDFARACHHYESSMTIARSIESRQVEGDVLSYLGLLQHHLGDDLLAIEYCRQALQIVQELGDRDAEARTLVYLGNALHATGRITEASDAFNQAISLRRSLGQNHLVVEPSAGLARAHLSQGNLIEAQSLVEEILGFLDSHSVTGTEEPLLIYLNCYQVLSSTQDPRAVDLLYTAYGMLRQSADRIKDPEMRRSYLEKVPVNRVLMEEYSRVG